MNLNAGSIFFPPQNKLNNPRDAQLSLMMMRLQDYYLIRSNHLTPEYNLKILKAIKNKVFPSPSERFQPINYSLNLQKYLQFNQPLENNQLCQKHINNIFTPITHKTNAELIIAHIDEQQKQVSKNQTNNEEQKCNSNQNLQINGCFHRIKKDNQSSSQKKHKLPKRTFQMPQTQISPKFINLTLHFLESLKVMHFDNYNVIAIRTFYELKLKVINQLFDQKLLICSNLSSYIEKSEAKCNDFLMDDRYEICQHGNTRMKVILNVFQTHYPIFNPLHSYEPNYEQIMLKQSQQKPFQVLNFTIQSGDKKLTWNGKTDIAYLNLTEIIAIGNQIDLYNINKLGYFRVPDQGIKLNKKRLVREAIPEELLILATSNEGKIDADYVKEKIQEHCKLLIFEFQYADPEQRYYEYFSE